MAGIILVSGTTQSIAQIARCIEAAGGRTTSMPIDRAFHSPLVDAVLPQFRQVLQKVSFSSPRIPIISNLTGRLAGPEITTVDYWLRHSREPVQFMKGMQTAGKRNTLLLSTQSGPVMMGWIFDHRS